MPLPVTAKLLKPKSPDEFEDLVLDALNLEWEADLSRNGRSGQRQNGVDLYGKRRRDPNAWLGVQCKDVKAFTDREIRDEVAKADSFKPSLSQYYFATSLDRDAKLQEFVRLLSDERAASGKFSVEILFWEDLERFLAGSPKLVKKYWGFDPAAVALVDLLYPPYEPLPTTSSVGAKSLATLLKPRYGQAPFVGREEECRASMAWVERCEPGRPRIQLCIAPGGEGKTRLAAEFARKLQPNGWVVGFVRPDVQAETLASALWAESSDALLVVDYAARRVDQLVGILTAAESRRSGRTALLLLERSQGEWWRELGDRLFGTRAAQDAVEGAVALNLKPLLKSARKEMFDAAIAVYRPGTSGALPRDDNTLAVQIAALLGMSGDRDQLLEKLLERERRYWRQMARARNLSGEPEALEAAVALATLARPSNEEASTLLDIVFEQGQVARAGAWLGDLYPGENASIGSLEPDMVGEALIAKQLAARPLMLGTLLERANEQVAAKVFDALARTGSTRPQVQHLVSAALRTMPPQLWAPAVRSAPALDESFARLLTDAFERAPVAPYGPILQVIPEKTLCLRELAASAQQREVAELREKRRLTEAPNSIDLELARSLNNLSIFLGKLGRYEEGLRAVQEAVEIRRKLADAMPDAFLPDLASALDILSIRLGELGLRDEGLRAAQEAVESYRKLAEVKPDAFLADLPRALHNLSIHLREMGHREEGLQALQEAVEIRRNLAKVRPDAFLPGLGKSLNNLSIHLREMGQNEEGLRAAQEAVEICRKLAAARPDAFLPDLAMSLNNFSIRMSELGRHEEELRAMQEAVEIYRKLAEARPDAFLPNLSKSLNYLSVDLGELGRHEEAAAARREAAAILDRPA